VVIKPKHGKMKKLLLLVPVLFFLGSLNLLANKTSVEIKAPTTAKKGTEVTFVISVNHKGNSKGHHTDWVTFKFNGKEVKRWDYTKDSLPASENFTIEYKMVIPEDGTIEVQGHCNIHGSAGAKSVTLKTT
jgi:desulfoferrodoxin (superoxide reductase-like protein)